MFTHDNEYISFLKSLKHRTFYLNPYPGNSGDLLIRNGTLQMFSDLGINQTNIPGDAEIILFSGGCPTMWPVVMDCIKESVINYQKAQIIIGPATFEYGYTDWIKVFERFSSRIKALFAREKRSYNNLLKSGLGRKIHIGLSHDPSLYLLNSDWHNEQLNAQSSEYILVSLRRDHEMAIGREEKVTRTLKSVLPPKMFYKLTRWARKKGKKRKICRIEKANTEGHPIKDLDVWTLGFEDYMDAVRRASEIHTDRLHVMIFGAMLGKKVFAYKTSYGKLENVYAQSLKDWTNVQFIC